MVTPITDTIHLLAEMESYITQITSDPNESNTAEKDTSGNPLL